MRAFKPVIVQSKLLVDHFPYEWQSRSTLFFTFDEVIVSWIVHVLLFRYWVHVLSDDVVELGPLQYVVCHYFHGIILLLCIIIERHESK